MKQLNTYEMGSMSLRSLICFASILATVSSAILDYDPSNFKPGHFPNPGQTHPTINWNTSLNTLTHNHVRNFNELVNFQPGEPMLKKFYQQYPVPLNSDQCNTKFTYNEKLVYDEDDFLCPKDVQLPPNFPRTDNERSPFTEMFGSEFGFADNSQDPDQYTAADLFHSIYASFDRPPFHTGNFKTCSRRNGRVDPHIETDGYKVRPACYARPVDYSNRPIAYRTENGIRPCYIPQPVTLEGVHCFGSKKGRSNRCTMGYISYHEYRCLPSNFIKRRVPLVCPGYGMAVINVKIPITCSCKICYNCGKNFDYDAYQSRPTYSDMQADLFIKV